MDTLIGFWFGLFGTLTLFAVFLLIVYLIAGFVLVKFGDRL